MTYFDYLFHPLMCVWFSVAIILLVMIVSAEAASRRHLGLPVFDFRFCLTVVGSVILLPLLWPVLVVLAALHVRRQAKRLRLFSPATPATDRRPLGERQWAEVRDPADLCSRAADLLPHRVRVQFAAACMTMNGPPPEEECVRAVRVALDGLDGRASAEALADARAAIQRRLDADTPAEDAMYGLPEGQIAALVRLRACEDLLRGDAASAAYRLAEIDPARRDGVRAAQLSLLREIAGNPFLAGAPGDYPPEVVGLAQACYDGDAALNGILADALEDFGRPDDAAHLRAGSHGKGCHVVERVLGLRAVESVGGAWGDDA